MTEPTALAALSDAEATVTKLDKLCCEPGRSPRMAELSKTLADATDRSPL